MWGWGDVFLFGWCLHEFRVHAGVGRCMCLVDVCVWFLFGHHFLFGHQTHTYILIGVCTKLYQRPALGVHIYMDKYMYLYSV